MSVQHFFINTPAETGYANDNDCSLTISKAKPQTHRPTAIFNSGQPRIDPTNLPYCNDDHQSAYQNVVRYLDEDRVILRRPEFNGNGASVNIPTDSYSMVAVRILPSEMGDQRIFARLELIHPDPSLNIVLAEAECPEHLAEDWSLWNHLTDLPLRLIDLDERIVTPPGAEETQTSKPLPRRFGSPLQNRRTRFHARRKTGQPLGNIISFCPKAEITTGL